MACRLSRQYENEKLWQRYCVERVLRSDEATLVVARYIVANPVRAGLVSQPAEYPFVGSCVVALRELLEAVAETREVRLKPDATTTGPAGVGRHATCPAEVGRHARRSRL